MKETPKSSQKPKLGTLYSVATQIGNLADWSTRSQEVLAHVLVVYAEDTRVLQKLLNHFEISAKTARLDDHSGAKEFARALDQLRAGEDIAWVSDAGTPVVADPGAALVRYCVEREPGLVVSPIPGPSAITAALSVSGFYANQFTFLGYPPHKKGRSTFFKNLAKREETLVLFESVHRIEKTLTLLADVVSNRQVVVCRELTKKFEQVYRGTAQEIFKQKITHKGEFVIVIANK